MARSLKTGVFALGVALGATISALPQNQSRTNNNVTNDVLRRAGTTADTQGGSWLSYGKTQSETRYSPVKLIDTTNAKRLGLEWSYVMGAGTDSFTCSIA